MTPLLPIAAAAGYLLGALPFGYLVARAHGVDIFKAGSGNPGATNVKRVLGSKAGNLVYILDALKGAVAAGWPLLAAAFCGATAGDPGWSLWGMGAGVAAGVVVLFAAVLGHSFSVFTRFKGGKGVATASGGLAVLMPVPIIVGLSVWFVTFLVSRYVSLASILAAATVPGVAWLCTMPATLKIMVTLLGALVIVRHQSNLRRLFQGTEHRWERQRDCEEEE